MTTLIEVTKHPRQWSVRSEWVNYPNGFVLTCCESMLFLLETNKVTLIGIVPDSYFLNENQEDLWDAPKFLTESPPVLAGT